MRTLRGRLLTAVIGVTALLLFVFSGVLYGVIRAQWLGQFDAELLRTARILAASVEADGNEVDLELHVEAIPEFSNPRRPLYYVIRRGDRVLAHSALLGERALPPFPAGAHGPAFRHYTAPDGTREHAVALRFVPRAESQHADEDTDGQERPSASGPPPELDLLVAAGAVDVVRRLELLGATLPATLTVVLILAVAAGVVVVRRALAPLERLAREIQAIDADNLDARLAGGGPQELAPVVDRLNDLLARLHAAFAREKRFAADAAHELRTPLAALRSALEVTRTRPREAAAYRRTLDECLALVEGQQAMVETLLALTRSENGTSALTITEAVPAALVEQVWSDLGDRAFDRGQSFENGLSPEWMVHTDTTCLTTILRNALDNAVTYAARGAWIRVSATREGRTMVLCVANSGCDLRPDRAEQVFDPFWRADAARTETLAHCGLGLALVRRLAARLGGTVTAHVEAGVFTLRIALPGDGPTGPARP